MKPNADEVVKTFKGLAIAAARAKTLANEYGKEKLVANLQRRQQEFNSAVFARYSSRRRIDPASHDRQIVARIHRKNRRPNSPGASETE